MKEPTKRQMEVLSYIMEYLDDHAYPPTIREVAEHFFISIKAAQDHVAALKKKGLLKQGEKKSRTMEVVNVRSGDREFMEIPVLGTVAAGKPILAEENKDGFFRLPRYMAKKNAVYFCLRVTGDSMIGAGIMEGDLAVIEQRDMVQNGEIAVVMLDDSVVVIKTFYRENALVHLVSQNPAYDPIIRERDVKILGRLAHIFRSYNISSDSL